MAGIEPQNTSTRGINSTSKPWQYKVSQGAEQLVEHMTCHQRVKGSNPAAACHMEKIIVNLKRYKTILL
jgi:hypothetical protein